MVARTQYRMTFAPVAHASMFSEHASSGSHAAVAAKNACEGHAKSIAARTGDGRSGKAVPSVKHVNETSAATMPAVAR